MAVVQRPTGITVSTQGSVTVREAPLTGVVKRGGKRTAKGGTGTALSFDSSAIVAEMQHQDAELIDVVPLIVAPSTKRTKRGTPPPGRDTSVSLDVPLGDDQQAVVLIEDEGEYRWIIGTKPPPRKRGVKGLAPRRSTFKIDMTARMAPAQVKRRVKRNWITEKVIARASVYVFRFVMKLAGKPLVEFLERKVTRGIVSITSADPGKWQLLADDAPLPGTMPKDRTARVLLLVHGTFSSTLGSYGALGSFAEGQEFLARGLKAYDFVLGFDHPTLSVDPEDNATALLKRLRKIPWPQDVELEMVAFSRAGLVVRSLVEKLLPSARWNVKVGRIVFVGCTNSGTQLAEPENWTRFADFYTNIALGATRALSYVPGTQPWTTIAGQAIQGVSTLVKALATSAVTDNMVPGLAAMEPKGPFVTAMNRKKRGEPEAKDARYYAITSNFQPNAGRSAAPELAPKFLLRLASWAANQAYREPNDLVVNVSSMTAFESGAGDFIKGEHDYGTNGTVYHTNYFAHPTTAKKLVEWFEIPAVAGIKRKFKRAPGGHYRLPKRLPVPLKELPATVEYKNAMAQINQLVAAASAGEPTDTVTPGTPTKLAPQRKSATPAKPVKRGGPIGSARARKRALAKGKKLRKKVATKAAKKKRGGYGGMGGYLPESVTYRPLGTGGSHGGSGSRIGGGTGGGGAGLRGGGGGRLDSSDYISEGGGDDDGSDVPEATEVYRARGPAVPPSPFAPTYAPSPRPTKRGLRPPKGKGTARGKHPSPKESDKVTCFFKGEIDSSILVNKPAPVDVTISRELLNVVSGKAGATTSEELDSTKTIIVELGDLRELTLQGPRRFEVTVPEPGEPSTCSFKVVGKTTGEARLTVHLRQGSVPLQTLELTTRIVSKLGKLTPRTQVQDAPVALPDREEPLDELRIYEQVMGDKVSYSFMLDLWSLKVREQYDSKPLDTARDKYVLKIMDDIGKAWVADQPGAMKAFERDIRSIGGKMYDQLIPPEMQRLLWDNRERIKSVQVFSLEPFVPWELVYLKDPSNPSAVANNKFLGELGLLRWIYKTYPPAKLRIRKKHAHYLIGDAGADLALPNAEKEAALLRKLLGAEPLEANLNELQELLEKPDSFDLLHICCHGSAAGEEFSQAQLFIKGDLVDGEFQGETLKADTVQQIGRLAEPGAEYRPIVVLNACQSARPNRDFLGLGGFAHAFVRAGAGAFVGSHWSIGDSPALQFVTAMYEAVADNPKKKLTLSEVVTKARQAARGKDDATWLAYVVYGHPRASVSVG
jgi:hypothetical protein